MNITMRTPSVMQINDHIWLINDNNEATCYLVAGEKYAMVIDTMIGLVNVREIANKLTDLPLICVNTHGHGDHCGGNWCFDKVYMNKADIPVVQNFFSGFPLFEQLKKKYKIEFPPFIHIEDEHIFDLGGLEIQAYYLPGHTPGEIVLIDRKDRILFSGDGIIEQIWLQLDESLPVRVQAESMRKIQFLCDEYDTILTGHSRKPENKELFYALLKAADELSDGKTENDIDYEWYGGKCKAHPYGKEPRRIVYNAK